MDSPISLLILADTPNWAFANRAKVLAQQKPDDFIVEVIYYDKQQLDTIAFGKYDLVFCLPTNLVGSLRRLFMAASISAKLVASHNSGVGRRYHMLLETLLSADYTIVNNYAAWANCRAICDPARFTACNISNGVDTSLFRVQTPIAERPHRALWCSSFTKLCLAGPDPAERDIKGYDSILAPLKILMDNRPEHWETDWLVVDHGAGYEPQEMANWYNSGSYVLCASRSEGTPNVCLEGAACGCVIVSTPVGNMPELVTNGENGVIVQSNTSAFWKGMEYARANRDRLSAAMSRDIQKWDWRYRTPYFYAVFRRVAMGAPPQPFSYLERSPDEI